MCRKQNCFSGSLYEKKQPLEYIDTGLYLPVCRGKQWEVSVRSVWHTFWFVHSMLLQWFLVLRSPCHSCPINAWSNGIAHQCWGQACPSHKPGRRDSQWPYQACLVCLVEGLVGKGLFLSLLGELQTEGPNSKLSLCIHWSDHLLNPWACCYSPSYMTGS